MPPSPSFTRDSHTFPKGKPLPVIIAGTVYVVVVVGWFFFWAFRFGFHSWRDFIPLLVTYVLGCIVNARLMAYYERKGLAVRTGQNPSR